MTITLLVSGALGQTCLEQILSTHRVNFVFTDRGSASIIQTCRDRNIGCFVGNPRGGRARSVLSAAGCEVLLSINYLFLVDEDIIGLPSLYAINLHGSLLPRYRGRTPHVWAVINGETVAGVTAHLMAPEMDAGDIVAQREVPITDQMTGADVLSEYQRIYPILLGELLERIARGQIHPVVQDERLATYFPKRTPADGAINWAWSRERVRNWIRAQAAPYPGAFFTFAGKQWTVHRSVPDPLGFRHENPDGQVLKVGESYIVVKLTNGALRIGPFNPEELRSFTIGDQLL
ncbi:methionyl-tRNA formyltransferase [Lewinella sp. JB7]|uniref:methionyl-tRNA formyltransferase n=1 Tax=Lewinella sp. JB7 TaxID=2962887 RepID=UPI0020CA0904|nr:methionyl-tRNA formyltransferase [Lewinella sp. JB7]MCP9236759.1 methionyl-tRNA formyltransferase [Lewinella sp. JB7]